MSPAERETVISFNDADAVAHVYTCHARIASHLIRRGAKPIRVDYRSSRKTPAAWTFEIPRSWFKVPGPPRKVSDAQREAARKALKYLHPAPEHGRLQAPGKVSLPVEGKVCPESGSV